MYAAPKTVEPVRPITPQQVQASMFAARPGSSSSHASSTDSTKPLCETKTTKKEVMLRCAIKGAIPIGFIGFSIIIFGGVQVALEDTHYAIGITLMGLGAVLMSISIFLCIMAVYLSKKVKCCRERRLKRQSENRLFVDRNMTSLPIA